MPRKWLQDRPLFLKTIPGITLEVPCVVRLLADSGRHRFHLVPWPEEMKGLALPVRTFRSFTFFELPTLEDTGTCSAERPCFLSEDGVLDGPASAGKEIIYVDI